MSTFTIEEESVDLLDSPRSVKSSSRQSSKQSTKQSSKQSTKRSSRRSDEHSDDQSTDNSIDQSTKKSKSKSKSKKKSVEDPFAYPHDQSINQTTQSFDPFDPSIHQTINQSMVRYQEQKAVTAWLLSNGFDQSIIDCLTDYSIDDLINFDRQDWKDLLGTKIGIKMYTRIKTIKQSNKQSIKQSINQSVSRSIDHSKYGVCSHQNCSRGAMMVCSNSSCSGPLCPAHAEKSLITGEIFCSVCCEQSFEGKISGWFQSINESISQSVENSIEATQALTGYNALPSLTDQAHDCTIM